MYVTFFIIRDWSCFINTRLTPCAKLVFLCWKCIQWPLRFSYPDGTLDHVHYSANAQRAAEDQLLAFIMEEMKKTSGWDHELTDGESSHGLWKHGKFTASLLQLNCYLNSEEWLSQRNKTICTKNHPSRIRERSLVNFETLPHIFLLSCLEPCFACCQNVRKCCLQIRY